MLLSTLDNNVLDSELGPCRCLSIAPMYLKPHRTCRMRVITAYLKVLRSPSTLFCFCFLLLTRPHAVDDHGGPGAGGEHDRDERPVLLEGHCTRSIHWAGHQMLQRGWSGSSPPTAVKVYGKTRNPPGHSGTEGSASAGMWRSPTREAAGSRCWASRRAR